MNDEQEGYDFYVAILKKLENISGSSDQETALELIETTIETNLRFKMAFCASSLKDDISQWRAYTELGQGICIEFDDNFIQKGIQKIDCVYDDSDKDLLIEQFGPTKENMEDINKSLENVFKYLNDIEKIYPKFKNNSFKPEREVRWIKAINGLSDESETLKFRACRLGLTSYIDVPVDLSKVKSITIGPKVPDQNLKTVEDFIIKNNCSGYVTKSKSSLR